MLRRWKVYFTIAVSFWVTIGLLLSTPQSHALEKGLSDQLSDAVKKPFSGDFDEILKRGYLRVLVPFSKTFYFIDQGVERGVSVDLITEFGKYLQAKHGKAAKNSFILFLPTPRDKLMSDLAEGRGDIALGNLTITPERQETVDFSSPLIADAREIPITSDKSDPLVGAQSLSGKTVHVRPSSSYFSSLTALSADLEKQGKKPVKIIAVDESLEDEELLELVRSGGLSTIVMDEHKAEFWSQVMDGFTIHTDAAIRDGGQIAIALRKDAPGLKAELNAFVATAKKGTLTGNIILKKYLQETGYLASLDDPKRQERFQAILDLFRKYGAQYDIDWLLVAAQSFQESRFRQDVKSRAGAVGLMQIKPSTAADRNVAIKGIAKNPDNNVHAGVKYLRFIADQYFADLKHDPINQTFFALAAYNAGPSRFDRLRKKAKEKGYDPNIWFDNVEWIVMANISSEPVRYVGNIYMYYVAFAEEFKRHQSKSEAAQ